MDKKPPYETWFYKFFWTAVLVIVAIVAYRYPQWKDLLDKYTTPPLGKASLEERKTQGFPEGKIRATLVRVVDGDTVIVLVNGRKERVRLIGIDTPESRPNRKAERDVRELGVRMEVMLRAGREAKEFLKKLLHPGDTVYLELDVQKRDKYGRLLAYLYLPDGRMVNEILLREGIARVYTVPPNVRYVDRFLQAQREARERGKGFWGEIWRTQ